VQTHTKAVLKQATADWKPVGREVVAYWSARTRTNRAYVYKEFVTNPDPDLELTRDIPVPVLYWQPMQLPSYFHVHLDLIMTQQDLYLLTLFLWILFSD